MKKIISLILLAALLCAGCAQQAATETTAATEAPATEPAEKPISYILYAIGPEDDLLEADMMQDELARLGYGYDEMYIEFHADGTGYMNLMGMEGEILYDETAIWTEEDPEERTEYLLEGNTLTIDNGGYLYIFER